MITRMTFLLFFFSSFCGKATNVDAATAVVGGGVWGGHPFTNELGTATLMLWKRSSEVTLLLPPPTSNSPATCSPSVDNKPQRSCQFILEARLHPDFNVCRKSFCQGLPKKKKERRGREKEVPVACIRRIVTEYIYFCSTNSYDSQKNKSCQFCRMCSFLFSASRTHWGVMVRHTNEREPQP